MRGIRLATALALMPAVVLAQDLAAPAPTGPTPVTCGDKTAAFADGRGRLWVVRRGTIVEDNPLRPLSAEPLALLEVIVGGRAATAVGVDYDNLHRSAASSTLEEQNRTKVAWAEGGGLPEAFRIVSEDGAIVSAYRFVECGDAPRIAAAPTKPGAARRAGRRQTGTTEPTAPRGFSMPQGAVPESSMPSSALSGPASPKGAIR